MFTDISSRNNCLTPTTGLSRNETMNEQSHQIHSFSVPSEKRIHLWSQLFFEKQKKNKWKIVSCSRVWKSWAVYLLYSWPFCSSLHHLLYHPLFAVFIIYLLFSFYISRDVPFVSHWRQLHMIVEDNTRDTLPSDRELQGRFPSAWTKNNKHWHTHNKQWCLLKKHILHSQISQTTPNQLNDWTTETIVTQIYNKHTDNKNSVELFSKILPPDFCWSSLWEFFRVQRVRCLEWGCVCQCGSSTTLECGQPRNTGTPDHAVLYMSLQMYTVNSNAWLRCCCLAEDFSW
jgi:hypothetical protein